MSHKLFCLFLCFLAFTKNAIASSDHSLATAEEVITSEVSPSTMVNDTVNVIEGSFSFSGFDLHVPGQESLHVMHFYNSKSRYDSWLGIGMSLNYSFWMAGTNPCNESNSDYSHLNVESAGGSIISYLGKEGRSTYFLTPKVIHKGITNCGSGELSGRTNLKNAYVKNTFSLTIFTAGQTIFLMAASGSIIERMKKRTARTSSMKFGQTNLDLNTLTTQITPQKKLLQNITRPSIGLSLIKNTTKLPFPVRTAKK
jgi:hypothetical protein